MGALLQVSGLAAGGTNSQLASSSWDGSLRLWDCEQLLTCTGQLVGHSGAVHAVAWEAGGGGSLFSVGQVGPALFCIGSAAAMLCLQSCFCLCMPNQCH